MHSRVCNAVPAVSSAPACKHSDQFAFLRKLTNAKPDKALRDGLVVYNTPRGPVFMGWDLAGKKKSHAEQIEHSHARVVR
jgi:hypothetical protein